MGTLVFIIHFVNEKVIKVVLLNVLDSFDLIPADGCVLNGSHDAQESYWSYLTHVHICYILGFAICLEFLISLCFSDK